MIAIRSHDSTALSRELEARDIVTSYRKDNLRISPHFYNNEQDIDRLFEELKDFRELLA